MNIIFSFFLLIVSIWMGITSLQIWSIRNELFVIHCDIKHVYEDCVYVVMEEDEHK